MGLKLVAIVAGIACVTLGPSACLGPHDAPELPVKGDHRYHGYSAVEARLHALNARDLEKLAIVYALDAEILDVGSNAPVARGRDAIKARYARVLAACSNPVFDVTKRKYAERGRIVSDLEEARCGDTKVYAHWIKYEIDVKKSQILRAWEPSVGGDPR